MWAKIIRYMLLVLSCLYAGFFLVCIWTDWINPELFTKITLTVIVIYALLFVFYFINGVSSDKDLKKKGLNPTFMKLVDHELIPTKLTKSRNVSVMKEAEQQLHAKNPLPKKVKPGYKKKRMEKINKELRKVKRERIEDIYRRRSKG